MTNKNINTDLEKLFLLVLASEIDFEFNLARKSNIKIVNVKPRNRWVY